VGRGAQRRLPLEVIVDREGRLRWSQSGDRLMTRSGAEIRRVLDLIHRLRTSG
jgi:hypothetical protein